MRTLCRFTAGMAVLLAASALTGCATIVNGLNQNIPVVSTPPAAKVSVDGKEVGVTPMTLRVPREAAGHRIKLEAAGYMPSTIQLTTSTAGVFWCNIIAWPLFLIDLLDGAMYVFTPRRIDESLTPWSGAGAGGPALTAPPRDPGAARLNIAVAELAGDGVSASDASVIANLLRGELVKTQA